MPLGDPEEIDAILTSYKMGLEEGERQAVDKIVDWLRIQQHGRTSDNYPGYYARRIADGEWK